jgi:hypothetical protein
MSAAILSGFEVTHGVTCDDPDESPGVLITLPEGCSLAGIDNVAGSPDAFIGNVSAAAKCGKKGSDNPDDWCDGPVKVGEDDNGRVTLCFSIRCEMGPASPTSVADLLPGRRQLSALPATEIKC